MNRKTLTLIIVGALILLGAILVALANLTQKNSKAAQSQAGITPPIFVTPEIFRSTNGTLITPVITGTDALHVVKSDPPNGATSVSSSTLLEVQFNKPFLESDVIFSIRPEVPFRVTVENAVLKVAFQKPLAESTIYTYKIKALDELPHTYSFTTYGTAPVKQPDTFPYGAAQIEEEYNRANNPDLFVANHSPHEEATFSLTRQYNESTRLFEFIVNSKSDPARAKTDVTAWLGSLGLSGSAIAQLKITYK